MLAICVVSLLVLEGHFISYLGLECHLVSGGADHPSPDVTVSYQPCFHRVQDSGHASNQEVSEGDAFSIVSVGHFSPVALAVSSSKCRSLPK